MIISVANSIEQLSNIGKHITISVANSIEQPSNIGKHK